MKANELRVGNWVEKTEIKYSGLKLYHSEIAINDLIHASSLKPIPLTEEWLLKFGFRKIKDEKSDCDDGDYTLVSNRFQVFTNDILTYNTIHGWWIDKKQFFLPCQYVHQLQNLYFALTGEELTLKNK